MKLISNKSKFLPLLLLVLLLIGVLLMFGKTYNTLIVSGFNITFSLILVTIIPIAVGIVFYYFINILQNKLLVQEAEIQSLKLSIETTIKAEKKEQTQQQKETTIDFNKIIAQIIPNLSQDDLEKYGEVLLANISKSTDIVQGLLFLKNMESGLFTFTAGYAFYSETQPTSYLEGDTLPGQVAKNKQVLNLDKIPDGYITILSGLGKSSPKHLLITPIINSSNETIGIIELASFKSFDNQQEKLFSLLGRKLGEVFNSNKPNSQE